LFYIQWKNGIQETFVFQHFVQDMILMIRYHLHLPSSEIGNSILNGQHILPGNDSDSSD